MKITVHRQGLLALCKTILGVIPTGKQVMPVLANFQVSTTDNGITVQGTDTEIGLRLDLRSVAVLEAGAALWPAAKLTAILGELPDDSLTITSDNTTTTIVTDSTEFELPGEDPSIFPDMPVVSGLVGYSLLASDVQKFITRTLFAVAEENARYTATRGILWDVRGTALHLVATDGRRLAVTEQEVETNGTAPPQGQPVVPEKALVLLARLLTDPDERIMVTLRANEILVQSERGLLYSRLVEGRFPNWQAVIPASKDCVATAKVRVGVLLTAVRQAATMTDEQTRRVQFAFTDGRLTLSAQGPQTGRAKVAIPIAFTGPALTIYLAPQAVLDFLKVLPTDEEVTWHLQDATSPSLLTTADHYRYVLVPIVVKETPV